VDDEKSDSVLTGEAVGPGRCAGVPRGNSSCGDRLCSTCGGLCRGFVSKSALSSSFQPDQPAEPPGGEVPWVSELLSEFSEVFQDPLPPGLPPERLEGHSIPTEPGHPPPFWSMYRLSPLEYRELEKQVTKILKDGILEVSQSPYGAPVLFVPKPNGRGCVCVMTIEHLIRSQ
jgi:hypothetical protein